MQKIENIKHYYSHWERLQESSKVYGVVWNEFLAYCYLFTSKRQAKEMMKRIIEYDPKLKCSIEDFNNKDIEIALGHIRALKLPDPLPHANAYNLSPDGHIGEIAKIVKMPNKKPR